MCEVSCQGLYLDVEHISEEMELPIDENFLSDETLKLLEEYKSHRNGYEQHLLNTMKPLLLDKTGWPFKTTQNKRVPVYVWTCLGSSQPPLPIECSTDSPDMDEHLKIYCKSAQKRIALMPEDCLGKIDEKTSDMCKEKELFWKTEAKCKFTRPRNMDSVLREECGCSIIRVEDTPKCNRIIRLSRSSSIQHPFKKL